MSNVFTYCPIKGERNQTPLEGETTFTNRKISFLLKKNSYEPSPLRLLHQILQIT